MKNIIIKTLAIASLIACSGCVSFNRDSLWNTPLKYEYNTYYPERVKVGDVFCHVNDDCQQYRMKYGMELKVKRVYSNNTVLLDIGWIIGSYSFYTEYDAWCPTPFVIEEPVEQRNPIIVNTLKEHNLKIGDTFNVYGQYKFKKYVKFGKKKTAMVFDQINDKNEHVFVEPFIEWNLPK